MESDDDYDNYLILNHTPTSTPERPSNKAPSFKGNSQRMAQRAERERKQKIQQKDKSNNKKNRI